MTDRPDWLMTPGARLRNIRGNESVRAFTARHGLSQGQWTWWEADNAKRPSPRNWALLVDKFGEDLMRWVWG
jgi:hypothetical protein